MFFFSTQFLTVTVASHPIFQGNQAEKLCNTTPFLTFADRTETTDPRFWQGEFSSGAGHHKQKKQEFVQSFRLMFLPLSKRGHLFARKTMNIDACRQGDRKALGELYAAYSHRLMGICRRYVKDESVAEDLLHDAFILIFASIGTLKDDARLEGWMSTIVRNLCLRHLQSSSRPTESLDVLPEEPCDGEPSEGDPIADLDTLLAAIEALPKGSREIFKLSVLDELSHKEIGQLLGIAPHSSSSQLFRAKKMLRGMLRHLWLLLLLASAPLWVYFFTTNKEEHLSENRPATVNRPPNKRQKTDLKEGGRTVRTTDFQAQAPSHQGLYRAAKGEHNTDSATDARAKDIDAGADIRPAMAHSDAIQQLIAVHPTTTDSLLLLPSLPHRDDRTANAGAEIHRKKRYPWTFNLGSSSNATTGAGLSNENYLSVIDYAKGGAASKIHTWEEYKDYMTRNEALMDSAERVRLARIGTYFSSGNKGLGEDVRHHRPRGLGLSLNKQLDAHWIFGTGVTYTLLKSERTSQFHHTAILKTQRISYIGIPLRLTYRIWEKGRFMAYATGGVTLELPVSGSLQTKYITGSDSISSFRNTLRPRFQWSVGLGVGLQYRLFRPFSFYIEPNAGYYFRNGSTIETYRTAHPFTFGIPFGLRLTW